MNQTPWNISITTGNRVLLSPGVPPIIVTVPIGVTTTYVTNPIHAVTHTMVDATNPVLYILIIRNK